MSTEIILPKLGLTMEEAKVVYWKKEVGESVEKDEVILEVETDKANLEVESPEAGILSERNVEEGETVLVGAVLGLLTNEYSPSKEEKHADQNLQNTDLQSANEVTAVEIKDENQIIEQRDIIRVSPAAKKLMKEQGLHVMDITGTGPRGRIVLTDVYQAAELKKSKPQKITKTTTLNGKKIPLSNMRKTIASRMTQSFMEVPQFQLSREVDCTALTETRKALVHLNDSPIKPSINDFIVQAVAKSLKEYPRVNASFEDADGEAYIFEKMNINIGIAVAVEQGLVVPVIKNADQLTLSEITRKRADLVEKAREGKLSLDEMSGGTFTISNLGGFFVDGFTAIINPPESGILAVGRVKDKAVVGENQEIKVRPMMNINGAFDHRTLDGVESARFLNSVIEQLESSKWKLF